MAGIDKYVGIAIALLTIAIVATLAPSLGDTIEDAIGTPAAGSNWDTINVTTTGADVYSDNISIVSIGILLTVIGGAIYVLRNEMGK